MGIEKKDRPYLRERALLLDKVRDGVKLTKREQKRLSYLHKFWAKYYEPRWISAFAAHYNT